MSPVEIRQLEWGFFSYRIHKLANTDLSHILRHPGSFSDNNTYKILYSHQIGWAPGRSSFTDGYGGGLQPRSAKKVHRTPPKEPQTSLYLVRYDTPIFYIHSV